MAGKETFLLVSLDEDKARKLAQVISNDACRKILDYLAQKKATETELARDLNMPISTVHYNLKHLVESNLVEAEEFHYSEKGKEVLHYSLANKYVVIAPKGSSEKFMDKLKSIIPAIAIIGAISLVLQFASRIFGSVGRMSVTSMKSTAEIASPERLMAAGASAADSSMQAAQTVVSEPARQIASSQPIGLWFGIGAVVCLAIYLLIDYIIKKRRSKS